MKRIIILLLCLISINVYADTCDKNELSRLKKLAEYVEINYTSEIKDKKDKDKILYKYGEYTLIANNLNDEIRVRVYQDYYGNKYREFKGTNGNGTLGPFYDGERVTVTIEGYVKNGCSGENLRTITVKLPYYNVYSENENCSNETIFHDTKCCQKYIEKIYNNFETFNNCLDNYYKNEYLNTGVANDNESNGANFEIIRYIVIGIIVFLFILFLVIFMRRKIKKSEI